MGANAAIINLIYIYIYGLFIPFSTLYIVLRVNTTRIILFEIMLQMFHHVFSRGPLSLLGWDSSRSHVDVELQFEV